MKFTVHITLKNTLSLAAGVCVISLAIIPLNVNPEHLVWVRWQIAIYTSALVAVGALVAQAIIQSKEDHQRDEREAARDKRQTGMESSLSELRELLKAGTPKPAITESTVKLEASSPSAPAEPPPDIDGEVHRLVMSPRHAAWPIVRDIFKLQGRPDDAAVDTDILVELYIVNQNLTNPQYIKDLRLSAEVNGRRVEFARQNDLMAGPFADHDFEYGLKTNEDGGETKPLKQLFENLPAILRPQQPANGWVRFMAQDINPDKIAGGSIMLKVVNSLGREYTISRAAENKEKQAEIGLRRLR